MMQAMARDRPPYGPLLSALGAIVLAVSVFLPWYGVSLTAEGVAYVQQASSQAAAQFGNATLQSNVASAHNLIGGLAGHELFAASAHQVLQNISVLLLVLAGVGVLISLLTLAGAQLGSGDAARGPLALLGAVAVVFVLYRIAVPPALEGQLFDVSRREGAWLSLLGAVAIVAGAMWPRASARVSASPGAGESVWSELSGWTPET